MKEAFKFFGYALKLSLKIYPEKLFASLLINIFSPVINFFSYAYMLRYLINGLYNENNIRSLIGYIVLVLVINIIYDIIMELHNNYFAPIINIKSKQRLNQTIYDKSISLDIANYEDPKEYQLYNRAISNGAEAINTAISIICDAISLAINVAMNSWLIFIINSVLFIFVLLPLLFNLINPFVRKKIYEFRMKTMEIDRKKDYSRRAFYLSEFSKEMRLTQIHRVMLKYFKDSIDQYIKLVKTDGMNIATFMILLSVGTNVIAILEAEMFAVYMTLVKKSILLGDCLVILQSISGVSYNIERIGTVLSKIYDTSLSVKDYCNFMNKKPNISLNQGGLSAAAGTIEFKNVSFYYNGSDKNVLSHIDLHIKQGEKVAIVGKNGAGKTTLIKLLIRLYDVSAGEIKLNGNNIKEYNLHSYRSLFGVVFQDYHYMSLSIADNVLGRPYRECDKELVISSLKKADIWDKIEKLPSGIFSIMTREFDDNGVVFSGGELQKISIASIYAKNPNIVILDEPSSALDPLAESEMYQNMYSACAGKTMIFISHRVSSATMADKIIYMDSGRIIECGTHKELIQLDGQYAKTFRIQACSYKNVE